MSHDRSTPSPSGSKDFATSAITTTSANASNISPTTQQFANAHAGLFNHNAPLSNLESFCKGRSDTTFRTLAGAIGGFTSGVVTCPLDVIKTKLQAQGGFRAQQGVTGQTASQIVYRGMLGTARVIWKEEGLKGMYRGLGPIIMGYIPTWGVWFMVYGKSKEYFSQHNENPNLVNFWSSIVAGGSSTMVTNPIWVIKTRLMSQVSRKSTYGAARPPWHYKSTLDAAKKMYKTEGFLSFYSGLTPALLGLTHVAVQFPAYEYLKTKFTGQGMGVSAEGDESSHWVGVLSASMLSKILASSATYPHEVIRTRLQTQQRSLPSASHEFSAFRGGLEASEGNGQPRPPPKAPASLPRYKGIITTAKTILREEGWRAFYAGLGTNMMRAVPAAATTMLTYEYIMRKLLHARIEGDHKSLGPDGEFGEFIAQQARSG